MLWVILFGDFLGTRHSLGSAMLRLGNDVVPRKSPNKIDGCFLASEDQWEGCKFAWHALMWL